MTAVPDPEALKTFNNNVAEEFRPNSGKVGGRFAGTVTLVGRAASGGLVGSVG